MVRHERWEVPGGSVSGGKKLAFLPLSGGVFPRKILARFGRGIHVAHSRAFWNVSAPRHPARVVTRVVVRERFRVPEPRAGNSGAARACVMIFRVRRAWLLAIPL